MGTGRECREEIMTMYEHYNKLPSNSSGVLNCTDSGEERDGADVVGSVCLVSGGREYFL